MRSRVVIVGGGVASLEAALALRELAGARVAVEIYSPRREFVYRPYAVGEPFGAARLKTYDLASLAERCGAEFHQDSIASVDPKARLATTHDGVSVPYDYLILAAGASRQWPVPGAKTFWGIADAGDVDAVMEQIRAGEARRVAFTMPGVDSWALPMYELALLTEAETASEGTDGVDLTVVTPEETPLQLFGRTASQGVAELMRERGIDVVTGTHPVRFRDGRLQTVPGEALSFDAVVSLPRLEGRAIRGVLHDPDGFARIDEHCRVLKEERIYAAGDVTSFPVKQGGIAAQQADVVAESIAAELGAAIVPQTFDPILRGVLWTGYAPVYLQGWLTGGHGETSTLSAQPPWVEGTEKIVARHLTPFLVEVDADHEVAVRA
jgi:sulfide:quinone oxidoreductase